MQQEHSQNNPKRPWESMQVAYLGQIKELVQTGGGKTTSSGTDPGENRKTSGSGNEST